MRGRGSDRSAQIERQIEPRRFASVAEEIFGGEVPPTRPEPAIIGNHELAVIAQIPRPEASRTEEGTEDDDLDARLAELGKIAPRQPYGTKAIEQHAHLDPRLRACRQAVDHLMTECVVADEERADVEGALGALDGAPQGIARLGAVRVHRD